MTIKQLNCAVCPTKHLCILLLAPYLQFYAMVQNFHLIWCYLGQICIKFGAIYDNLYQIWCYLGQICIKFGSNLASTLKKGTF